MDHTVSMSVCTFAVGNATKEMNGGMKKEEEKQRSRERERERRERSSECGPISSDENFFLRSHCDDAMC